MGIYIRLKELLEELNKHERGRVTLRDVAEQTGIHESTLYRWANQQATRYDEEVIVKLCAYFECSPNDLLEIVEDDRIGTPAPVALAAA